MHVGIISFGFKRGNGGRPNADLTIDVRHLPNPHHHLDFAKRDGRDANVRRWLLSHENVNIEIRRGVAAVWNLITRHRDRGQVLVAVGCYGGRHRSVVVAEEIARMLATHSMIIEVCHLELEGTP